MKLCMWTIHAWATCQKELYWGVPICVPLQWWTNFIISVHFISFILDFLCSFPTKSLQRLYCARVQFHPRGEKSQGGEKNGDVGFFHETRLISLVWVSTTLVKPGISLPRPQSVSAPYPQSAGRRLRNPISSSVAAPTFASQCYRRDFFFQNGFGKNM